MSIESSLKRIADALEKIADRMSAPTAASVEDVTVELPTAPSVAAPAPPAATASEVVAATTAPVPPAPPAQTPAAPAAAIPTTTALTPEQMNDSLVAEFKRLGSREPIDAAMAELGVTSVTDLPADKQQELLIKVRAIQP